MTIARRAVQGAVLAGLVLLSAAAAGAGSLRPDRNRDAPALARAACHNDDFDGFLIALANASTTEQRQFMAKSIEVTEVNARPPNASGTRIRRVSRSSYGGFPLAMFNHHYVRAMSGRLARDDDGAPQFLQVASERQSATLSDYPAAIVTVSWRTIRYGVVAQQRGEGNIVAYSGDSGRLLFATGENGCWELFDAFTRYDIGTRHAVMRE